MSEKAKIQKLKEDMLLNNGSKKHIFPVTVERAVTGKSSKKAEKITTLNNILNEKVSTMKCYTLPSLVESNYIYLLVTFATEKRKAEFENIINYSHEEFIEAINNSSYQEDIDNIDSYLSNEEVGTSEVFKNRVKYKFVKDLYLDVIDLHRALLPETVFVDENGNQYRDGDTVYLNKYPGVLYILTTHVDKDAHIEELVNIIRTITNSNFFFELSSPSSYNSNFLKMLSYWHKKHTETYKEVSEYPEYGDMTIAAVNDVIDSCITGAMGFNILPSDYPFNQPKSVLDAYCAEVKKGTITFRERVLDKDNKEILLSYGIPSASINVVFNPQSVFSFISPVNDIEIKSSDGWISSFLVKGAYPAEGSTVILSLEDNAFKLALDRETGDWVDTLTLTKEQFEEGTTIYIKPYFFDTNENGKLPGEEGQGLVDTLNITYNDTTNDIVVSKSFVVKAIPDKQDVEDYHAMILNIKVTSDKSNRLAVADIHIDNNPEVITINKVNIIESNSSENTISVQKNTVENVPFKYTYEYYEDDELSIGGVMLLLGDAVTSHSFSVEELNSNHRVILAVPIKEIYSSSELTGSSNDQSNGQSFRIQSGIVQIYGETETGTPIYIECPFNFSSNPVIIDDTDDWAINSGTKRIIVAETKDEGTIVNRIMDKVFTNVVTINDVKTKKTLKEAMFSGLSSTEDMSFVQYYTNLTSIPRECFANDSTLRRVILPENITEIGDYAFVDSSITELVIPDSVTKIGAGICSGCSNLKKVIFGSGLDDVTSEKGFTNSTLDEIWVRSEIVPYIRPEYYGLGIRTPTFSSENTGNNSVNLTLYFLPEVKIRTGENTFDTVTLNDGETVEESAIADTSWAIFPKATIKLIND